MAMTCDRVRDLASGFVLGALDTGEMIAVSDHLETCRKPHPEVGDLGGVLPYLAESLEPVEPPAWLRESVMAAAKADLVARRRAARRSELRVTAPVSEPAVTPAVLVAHSHGPAPLAEVISLAAARVSRARRVTTWATRVAAAVAIVALAGYSLLLQGQLADARRAQDREAAILYALTQQDTRTAQLTATDGSRASGIAALRPTGHIIVTLHGLTPTKGDQVYVVWLSGDGGTAIEVGYFTVDDSGEGYLEVDNVPTSARLWLFVCREPNHNVARPSPDMVVSGIISL
jgi:hypothetical protein